jgi:hypothetical protein
MQTLYKICFQQLDSVYTWDQQLSHGSKKTALQADLMGENPANILTKLITSQERFIFLA